MKTPIIILHGWGISGEKFIKLQKLFEQKEHTVFAPDLPGFGETPLVKKTMVLDDYVEYLHQFLKQKKITRAILIGHSFGGRVAAKFSITYPEKVEKLILTGAPLIKRPLSPKKKVVFYTTQLLKVGMGILPPSLSAFSRKLIYYGIGEWDYYKSGSLKTTFQAIIREDLRPLLGKLTVPTLIIWGENDTIVSIRDGKEIATLIKNAQFVSIAQTTHKLPYEDPASFSKAVFSFIS